MPAGLVQRYTQPMALKLTTRREHLVQIGIGAAALPLTAQSAFHFFDEATAREIEALAAQIIPTDDSPGAREAGVIYFIDRALGGPEREKQAIYKQGLAAVQDTRKSLFAGSTSIVSLSGEQCEQLIRAIETTEFFQTLREHTVMGFFGNPSYGGNRNKIGWSLIGFEDAHHFTPPFGYYDSPQGLK